MVEATHTNPTNINTALCINSRAIGSGTGPYAHGWVKVESVLCPNIVYGRLDFNIDYGRLNAC